MSTQQEVAHRLEWHMTEHDDETGCALRCGWHSDDQSRAEHLAASLAGAGLLAGDCICNTGPDTEGPDEFCPRHGRPTEEWIERAATEARRASVLFDEVQRLKADHAEQVRMAVEDTRVRSLPADETIRRTARLALHDAICGDGDGCTSREAHSQSSVYYVQWTSIADAMIRLLGGHP